MKSVKTLTRYSNELARQSVIALDATLRERLVRSVADKLDVAFIAVDKAKDIIPAIIKAARPTSKEAAATVAEKF